MASLTLEQVLDELAGLAELSHAQIIELLFIRCALGNRDNAPEGADAVTQKIAEAASDVASASRGEMRLLRRINGLLVAHERDPSLGRATHVESGPSPTTELAPLTAAQLHDLLHRQLVIARAIDERYAQLGASIDPAVLGEDLAGQIGFILPFEGAYADFVTRLRDKLATLTESQYLIATRDEPHDELERGLRDLSDRYYDFVITALRVGFANPDVQSTFVDRAAVGAMDSWDAVNSRLAEHKLLPAFTLP